MTNQDVKNLTFETCGLGDFSLNSFMPVKNRTFPGLNKPVGGLWASPVQHPDNWRNWCIQNDYYTYTLEQCFYFHLKQDAKIKIIASYEDLIGVPDLLSANQRVTPHTLDEVNAHYRDRYAGFNIDFEKLAENYDALFVDPCCDIWHVFTSWDVVSLLVFNPDVVEVL